jgi:hypothetical protein
MRRVLTVGAAVAVALAVGAQGAEAKTRRPATLPMSYAKHQAWEQMESYVHADGQRGSNIDDESTSCKRVSRSVIDCKQSVLVWSDSSGCYADDPGVTYAPADVARCAPSEGETVVFPGHYEYRWEGERRSWTMRYRAGQARFTTHIEAYFPKDRWAETNPEAERFGGLAIRVVDEHGNYS